MNIVKCVIFVSLFSLITSILGCSTQPVKPAQVVLMPVQHMVNLDKDLEILLSERDLNLERAKALKVQYEALLAVSPEYVSAQVSLYRLSYSIVIQEIDIDNEEAVTTSLRRLLKLYLKMPSSIRRELLPPTMVLYQAKYFHYLLGLDKESSHQYILATGKVPQEVTQSDLYQLILLSIKTSPDNVMVRGLAANHAIERGYTDFGEAVLKALVTHAPNSPMPSMMLGDHYFNQVWGSDCIAEHKGEVRKALSAYKHALDLSEDENLNARRQMALMYAALGLKPLALNEAKILLESEDYQALWRAGYIYMFYQKLDLSGQAFEKANAIYSFDKYQPDRAYTDYLMVSGQWIKAVKFYRKYLEGRPLLTMWDTLYAQLVLRKAQTLDATIARSDVYGRSVVKVPEHSDWPNALMLAFEGKEVGASLADNVCQKVQLAFHQGASAILKRDDYKMAQQKAQFIKTQGKHFLLESLLVDEVLVNKVLTEDN